MDVKLSTDHIRTLALLEKVARVHAKDCIITDQSIYFLVDADSVGMAIGKNGMNIKELRRIAGKNIKVFAYSPRLEDFIRNIIPALKSLDVNGKQVTAMVAREDKVTVIGRGGDNINAIRELLKRHFGVESFKLR